MPVRPALQALLAPVRPPRPAGALLLLGVALGAGDGLDARGWSAGTPAARAAAVLTPPAARPIALPALVGQRVTRTTLLFYFSPTCPHCIHAMPELLRLHGQLAGEVDFLGVATGSSDPVDVSAFAAELAVPFPIVHDWHGEVGQALRVTSTPTVLVVRPVGDGFEATDAYYPWFEGASLFVRMRLHPERGMAAFVPGEYLGARACGACHEQETQGWAMTHHAAAYGTLFRREEAGRAECVRCHVTGLGAESGFALGRHGSALAGVTCEACHGPSGPHDGEPTDASASCAGCHDPQHSVGFSLERGLPLIDHYQANALSEAEQDARWQALVDGTAARPLLAFHDGPTVGSAACASCHSAEHSAWAASAHGQARGLLKRKQAASGECLACHATPTAFVAGVAPQSFRNEGVGCESCHGPGGEHAQAPSAANILGLGESCPECVIEGVCTSCHTPQQDPDWALGPRLEAVRGHGPEGG